VIARTTPQEVTGFDKEMRGWRDYRAPCSLIMIREYKMCYRGIQIRVACRQRSAAVAV